MRTEQQEFQLRKPTRGETQTLYDPDAEPRLIETVLENGWMVVQHLEMQNGRRVVAELRICPAPPDSIVRDGRNPGERPTDGIVPPGGIKVRVLREIEREVGKHETFLHDYRAWIATRFGADALARYDHHNAHPGRTRGRAAPKGKRASDRYYAELAQAYVQIIRQGIKKPVDQLAILRGETAQRIRDHVHLARANGFLTQTTRGKVGGELTPKAKRLLNLPA